MKRRQSGQIDIGATAEDDLGEGRSLHMPDHHLALCRALHCGQHVEPIISGGIDHVVASDPIKPPECPLIAFQIIGEQSRLTAQSSGIDTCGLSRFRHHIAAQGLPAEITLTEAAQTTGINPGTLRGQAALFADYLKRYQGTFRRLDRIGGDDVVYATTDYWFDVLPAVKSPAQRKMMIWHMQAPSLAQIIFRSRADVDLTRLASLHYWKSQNVSLRKFNRCSLKRLLYVHPGMRQGLLGRGFEEREIKYVSFGVDPEPPGGTDSREKKYDAVWIGRVHRQKGIEDLLQTLSWLTRKIPGFRAVIIGKVKSELEPVIEKLGLSKVVDFPGFVSEQEKFRLFRASRVYLMPSRFEVSPRGVGEALIFGLPAVAYDVETYRRLFGEFLRYVPCYDIAAFQREAEEQV